MSSTILPRISLSDPHATLRIAQEAPAFLKSHPARLPQFPFSLFAKPETIDLWTNYETLFLACLKTGDDKSALECLKRLTARFGPANERIMALRGLYDEARAKDNAELEAVLEGYEKILLDNPVNVPIMKRRIALLRSMSRHREAISALVKFVDSFPTDAEAWCELSDLYQSQGMCSQAIFCLEEALLIAPNAWNLHARLGELQYISTTSAENPEATLTVLAESVKRFCRSIELCDDYLRGYYGLKLSTTRLLERMGSKAGRGGDSLPSRETLGKLQALATKKLRELVKSRCSDVKSWEWNQSDLIAAQELLEKDGN
ncbi:hypothetical protein VTO42DRAFT_2450 [Malbranchea cinnamomea]